MKLVSWSSARVFPPQMFLELSWKNASAPSNRTVKKKRGRGKFSEKSFRVLLEKIRADDKILKKEEGERSFLGKRLHSCPHSVPGGVCPLPRCPGLLRYLKEPPHSSEASGLVFPSHPSFFPSFIGCLLLSRNQQQALSRMFGLCSSYDPDPG